MNLFQIQIHLNIKYPAPNKKWKTCPRPFLFVRHICSSLNSTTIPKAAKEPASPSRPVMRQSYTETVFVQRDSFKINPTYNSDGLIKCLRQRQDSFVIYPSIYAFKLSSVYKILWHPDSFAYRDSIIGAVGRRAGALFFARTETISSWHETSLPSIWTWYRLTTSPWQVAIRPSTGTGKKRGTATQNAPN